MAATDRLERRPTRPAGGTVGARGTERFFEAMGTTEARGHLGDIGGRGIPSCSRTIIIPAYNEERRIGPTLSSYLSHFSRDTEIMVVLNGCRDRTAEIACSFLDGNPHLRVIDEPGTVGKGGAITLGFRRSSGDIIAYVDADGATSAAELERLMSEVGDFDGVLGSRWIDTELVHKQQNFYRRLASRSFNLVVRVLFRLPYKDTQCGAKVFRREAVETVTDELGTTNMAFDVDLLYLMRKHGLVLREVPTVWADQPGSKVEMRKSAPKMLLAVIRMRVRHSRLGDLVK